MVWNFESEAFEKKFQEDSIWCKDIQNCDVNCLHMRTGNINGLTYCTDQMQI